MNQPSYLAEAQVGQESGLVQDLARQTPFFAVSLPKLLIMSICTLSAYQIYWFYQNWRRMAAREPGKILPAPRALFGVIYCYACFARIRDFDARLPRSSKLAAAPLAIGWIVTSMMWRLPDPYWWIAMSAALFLLPVQLLANRINTALAPGHALNASLTRWNWVAVVLGGSFVGLALLGTFMAKTSQ